MKALRNLVIVFSLYWVQVCPTAFADTTTPGLPSISETTSGTPAVSEPIPRFETEGLPSISEGHEDMLDAIEEVKADNAKQIEAAKVELDSKQKELKVQKANAAALNALAKSDPSEANLANAAAATAQQALAQKEFDEAAKKFEAVKTQKMPGQPTVAEGQPTLEQADAILNPTDDPGKGKKVSKKNEAEASRSIMASNVLLIGIALSAAPMIIFCRDQYSAWAYFASAVLYVGNEINLFGKYKDGSEREMSYYERDDVDKQVKSLEQAAKQTEDAAKAAQEKAQFASYAMMGFTLASALAFMEALNWIGASGMCKMTSIETRPKEFFASNTMEAEGKIAYLNAGVKEYDSLILLEELERYERGFKSSMGYDEYEKLTASWEKDSSMKELMTLSAKAIVNTILPAAVASPNGDDKKKKGKGLSKAKISDNTGGTVALLGLGSVAGYVMTQQLVIQSTSIKEFLASGYTRGALFAGFALAANVAKSDIEDAAGKLNKRAGQYRELAGELKAKSMSNIENGFTTPGQSNVDTQTVDTTAIDGNSDSSSGCVVGGRGEAVSDPECKCKDSNSCKTPDVPNLTQIDGMVGAGGVLAEGASTLGAASSSLFQGDTSGGSTNGNNVGKLAAKIRKIKSKAQKAINDKLKAAGKTPVKDWDAYEKGTFNKYMGTVQKAWDGLSGSDKSKLMARIPALSNDNAKGKGKQVAAKSKVAMKKANGLKNIGKGGKKAVAEKQPGMDLNFDFEENKPLTDEEMAMNGEGMANTPAKDGEDINDNRNKDIFKIITGRYQKTAYPVFFELLEEE